MAALTEAQRTELAVLITATAQAFVEEFGKPLDSSTTDWDAVAWDEDARHLSFYDDFDTDSDLYNEAWEYYCAALKDRTCALVETRTSEECQNEDRAKP